MAEADLFDPVAELLRLIPLPDGIDRSAQVDDLLEPIRKKPVRKSVERRGFLPDDTEVLDGGVCALCSDWVTHEILDQLGYCPRCSIEATHVDTVEVLSREGIVKRWRDEPVTPRSTSPRPRRPVLAPTPPADPTERRLAHRDAERMALTLMRQVYADEWRAILGICRIAHGLPMGKTIRYTWAGKVVDDLLRRLLVRARSEAVMIEARSAR